MFSRLSAHNPLYYMSSTTLNSTASSIRRLLPHDSGQPMSSLAADVLTVQILNLCAATSELLPVIEALRATLTIPPVINFNEITSIPSFRSEFRVWGWGLPHALTCAASVAFTDETFGFAGPQVRGVTHAMCRAASEGINIFTAAHASRFGPNSLENCEF